MLRGALWIYGIVLIASCNLNSDTFIESDALCYWKCDMISADSIENVQYFRKKSKRIIQIDKCLSQKLSIFTCCSDHPNCLQKGKKINGNIIIEVCVLCPYVKFRGKWPRTIIVLGARGK